MPSHSVLLVEDEVRTRSHLARSIESEPGLALSAAVGSCAEARAALREAPPDVLLTDLDLPDGNGIELIREVRQRWPRTEIMVVTVSGDERTVLSAVEAGAGSYLLKQGTREEIGAAILQLLEGGSPISAPIARHLLRRFQAPDHVARDLPDAHLTERETEILKLVAKGFRSSEIGELLSISPHTVTTHIRHIYEKLEVNSRGAAVYEAVNRGLIRTHE